jgi:hypothetical protein
MCVSLPRLIDLAAQLEQDSARAPDWLRRRDRALARELGGAAGDASDAEAGVAVWLDRVRPEGVPSEGERALRAGRLLAAALLLGGALLGGVAAAALFTYDGTHPVNVVRVLSIFVGLQLVLLLATLVLCLPEAWRRYLPGLATLQDALALLSPGRWQGALGRLLPGSQREAADRLAGMVRRQQQLYGNVQKWWILSASQGFGVGFNLAALGVALFLVTTTDLAFAWSTTLDVDAEALVRVTRILSLPWAGFWQAAVPTPELIAATQYFRADAAHAPGASAPWWRFLLACMALYGLLPRVSVLVWARLRLRAAVRTAFRRVPGVAALRDRLESQLVETAAEAEQPGPAPEPGSAHPRVVSLDAGARCRAVVWAGFPIADAAAARAALGVEVVSLHRAGEGGLEEDGVALRALREAGGGEPVLVLAKAWEPPVLELLDFLAEVREAVGEARAILVVPLALGEGSRVAPPSPRDAVQWSRAADRLGDPWTSVHTVGASG